MRTGLESEEYLANEGVAEVLDAMAMTDEKRQERARFREEVDKGIRAVYELCGEYNLGVSTSTVQTREK